MDEDACCVETWCLWDKDLAGRKVEGWVWQLLAAECTTNRRRKLILWGCTCRRVAAECLSFKCAATATNGHSLSHPQTCSLCTDRQGLSLKINLISSMREARNSCVLLGSLAVGLFFPHSFFPYFVPRFYIIFCQKNDYFFRMSFCLFVKKQTWNLELKHIFLK